MPRDGSGIYTKPFPDVVEGTTIESTVHNGTVADVETDLNAPRPIIAGGTGATSATQARTNLKAEVAGQQVTNYDSHTWENGSFFSSDGATGGPLGSVGFFSGICHKIDSANLMLEARQYGDPQGKKYLRIKTAGTWGSWTAEADEYVNTTGDTMTGNLVLDYASPAIALNAATGANSNTISGLKDDKFRWIINLGTVTTEAGSNTGSDFSISRFNDAGVALDAPLVIGRNSGRVNFPNPPSLPAGLVDTAEHIVRFAYAANTTTNTLAYDIDSVPGWIGLWDTTNSPAARVISGYQKLGSGMLFQWGTATPDSAGDVTIAFPVVFPNAILNVVTTTIGGSQPVTIALPAHINAYNTTVISFQGRYCQSGGVVGAANLTLFWQAIGW